jgi:hypothetical protein
MDKIKEWKQQQKERELDKIYNLFYVARNCVQDECGDGSGLIVTEKYMELANLFQNFNDENGNEFPSRSNNFDNHYISFINDQESLSFTDNKAYMDSLGYEFIVKFNTFYIGE